MCECYRIGGPFIAEDPDCPIHGLDAQADRARDEEAKQALQDQIDYLKLEVERLNKLIKAK